MFTRFGGRGVEGRAHPTRCVTRGLPRHLLALTSLQACPIWRGLDAAPSVIRATKRSIFDAYHSEFHYGLNR